MQNVSALLLWQFFSDMFRPVVLAAKVHRAERLLQRAAQEARQACVESSNKVAQASASWLSAGCLQRQGMPQAPQALASLGLSAAWSALAGHAGLVINLAAVLSGVIAVSVEKS